MASVLHQRVVRRVPPTDDPQAKGTLDLVLIIEIKEPRLCQVAGLNGSRRPILESAEADTLPLEFDQELRAGQLGVQLSGVSRFVGGRGTTVAISAKSFIGFSNPPTTLQGLSPSKGLLIILRAGAGTIVTLLSVLHFVYLELFFHPRE